MQILRLLCPVNVAALAPENGKQKIASYKLNL